MYLENKRYDYEQYFSAVALDKHHPKFRYEISKPVRQCSDNANYISAGYLSCTTLGISGSHYDYYQSGYISQIQWSGDWYFSTEQDPNDRVMSWEGKLDCSDPWCFHTDSGGYVQTRCHWYVRFVERRGDEGQFDYFMYLLIKNDNKPESIPIPISIPHGTISSQSDVNAVCS